MTTTLSPLAHADPGDIATRYKVNDADPISSIPTEQQRNDDPIAFGNYLQDLIARAEGAFRAKDYAKSVKFYEALARAVPKHALPFSRLCSSYAELGKLDVAAANCAAAVRLDGARVLDHFRLVSLMLENKQLSTEDVANIDASLAALRQHAAQEEAKRKAAPPAPAEPLPPPPAGKKSLEQVRAEIEADRLSQLSQGVAPKTAPSVKDLSLEIDVLACRVGVRLNDAKRLDECVKTLKAKGVDLRLELPFEWALAVVKHDRAAAAALLDQARQMHFPQATLNMMSSEQDKAITAGDLGSSGKRWLFMLLVGLGLVLTFGLVRWLRRAPAGAAARPTSS